MDGPELCPQFSRVSTTRWDVIAGLLVGGIAVTLVDAARNWFAHTARLTPYAVRSVESEPAD